MVSLLSSKWGWCTGGAQWLPLPRHKWTYLQDGGTTQRPRRVSLHLETIPLKIHLQHSCLQFIHCPWGLYCVSWTLSICWGWRFLFRRHGSLPLICMFLFSPVLREGSWWKVRSLKTGHDNYIPNIHVAKIYHGWALRIFSVMCSKHAFYVLWDESHVIFIASYDVSPSVSPLYSHTHIHTHVECMY